MKKRPVKLTLKKKSISNLESPQHLEKIKGGFSSPCYGTIGGEEFCTGDITVDLC